MTASTEFMPSPKILFVDEPFSESEGSRACRSRYVWKVLASAYDADLLLLKSSVYQEKPVAAHAGYDKLYSLSLDGEKTLIPDSYHKLGSGQSERFAAILDSKRYELVVLAGLACLPLSRIVHKVLPQCPVVLDVDKLPLPKLEQAWVDNKRVENYLLGWQLFKQKAWDKLLLNKHSYYLCNNPADLIYLNMSYRLPRQKLELLPSPLILPDSETGSESWPEGKFILFWGDPDENDNLDLARVLVSEIYPRISKRLVEKNIGLVLCGSEKLQELSGGRVMHAPYDNFKSLLDQALFAILPLAKPDREMRWLRCGMQKKALLCLKSSLPELPFPEDSIFAESDINALVDRIIQLLRTPALISESAVKLHEHYLEHYTEEKLDQKLITICNNWIKPKHE